MKTAGLKNCAEKRGRGGARCEIVNRAREPKFTESQVLNAISESSGIVSSVASKLKCRWNTARKYIDLFPTAVAAMDAERETLIDVAERTLAELLTEEDAKVRLNACQFVLERIGKRRGYSQRQEIDHTTNGKEMTGLTVRFVGADEP